MRSIIPRLTGVVIIALAMLGAAGPAGAAPSGQVGVVANITVPYDSFDAVVDTVTRTVFVSSPYSSTVTVIDDRTNHVVASISYGDALSLDVDAAAGLVFVLNEDGNVGVLDAQNNTYLRSFSVGNDLGSTDLAVDPSTHQIFVGGRRDDPPYDPVLLAYDESSGIGGVVAELPPNGGSPLNEVTVNPDTHEVFFVSGRDNDSIGVYSEDQHRVTSTIDAGQFVQDLAVRHSTDTLYAALPAPGRVETIDATTGEVTGSFHVPSARGVALDQQTGVVYADSTDRNNAASLDIVNAGASRVTQSFPMAAAGRSIGVEPATGTAYAAERYSTTVTAVRVPPRPTVSAVAPDAGPAGGGQQVTISGTSFTGATKVIFGTVAATSFTVASDGSITASAPPHSPGVVHVRVVRAGGISAASAADTYTYGAGG